MLGGTEGSLRVPVEALVETASALLEGARKATRFMVEGESSRSGPRPAWLDAACRLEVTGLKAGSTVVEIEAPPLAEADPEHFGAGRQVPLFADPARAVDASLTAVDLFGTALADALGGDRETLLADRALLDACARFARATTGAFHTLQLEGVSGATAPIIVRSHDVPRLELLRDETSPPRAVRVSGTLDRISASAPDVLLRLGSGETVAARMDPHNPSILRDLFGRPVVVSGVARFRPSGRLLIIDVEHLAPAAPTDRLFELAPVATAPRYAPPLVPQDESSGVAALFGTWPGDESDEDLQRAIEALE